MLSPELAALILVNGGYDWHLLAIAPSLANELVNKGLLRLGEHQGRPMLNLTNKGHQELRDSCRTDRDNNAQALYSEKQGPGIV